jgi:hypothetical protein
VLDELRNRLYVYTRFDNGLSVVNPTTKTELRHLTMHSPELPSITVGRRMLYDTKFTSSNGEASCAVCHVFADFDSLAWDLGAPSPDGAVLLNNNPFVKIGSGTTGPAIANLGGNVDFHPLKGPMTTQTLRGMDHHGPMHWRGDRSGGQLLVDGGGNPLPSQRNTSGNQWAGDPNNALDEGQAFVKFNVAFVGLLGRDSQLATAEMNDFRDFILQVQQPPNPIRAFDHSLTASQAAGAAFYTGQISDTIKNCNGCHTLDPAQGFFGTSGRSTFEGLSQHFKVAHLRNAYQKVGMYGMGASGGIPAHGGADLEQVRGFGYLHDGSVDNVISFLNRMVFQFPADAVNDPNSNYGNDGATMRQNVANFVMAFPSDIAPIVGQQITRNATNGGVVDGRITFLAQRALTLYPDVDRLGNTECDLIVKARIGGVTRGWWLSAADAFTPDKAGDPTLTAAGLLALATGTQELTYTCVPPGSGQRMGIDRGGVGDSSQPDGIRDANQCGDVTADGVAANADVAAERAMLALASTPAAPGKCNVAGPAGSGVGTCNLVDIVVLRRAIAGLGPALTSGCNG